MKEKLTSEELMCKGCTLAQAKKSAKEVIERCEKKIMTCKWLLESRTLLEYETRLSSLNYWQRTLNAKERHRREKPESRDSDWIESTKKAVREAETNT